MNFEEGTTTLTDVQQLISFWTHTIDIYMLQFYEYKTSMISPCVPVTKTMSDITGIFSEEAYMGAIRAGFKHSITSLPEDARVPIECYFEDRLRTLKKSGVRSDLIKCDVIFGNKNPTNFYYSGVRLQEGVPLTSEESDINPRLYPSNQTIR